MWLTLMTGRFSLSAEAMPGWQPLHRPSMRASTLNQLSLPASTTSSIAWLGMAAATCASQLPGEFITATGML